MGSSTTNSTTAQNQAQNSLSNMLYGSQSGTSTGQTTAASSVGASGPSALAQQYLASGAAPISGSAISNYSNPYQTQVTDTTMAQLGQMFGQQQAGVVGSAISGSALGGGRQALSQALLGNQQGLAAGSTLAGLNANNFNTSLQAAQSDANRQIAAAGLSGTQTAQQQQGQTAGQTLAQNLGQIVQGSTMQGAGTGSSSTTSNPSMLSMLGTGVGAMGAMGKGSGGAVRGMADGGSIHRADGGNATTDIALTGGMNDSGMNELMQMLALSRSMQQPMVPMKLNQSNAGQGQQSSQGKGLSSLFKGLGGNNNSSSDNSSSGDTSGDTSGLGMDSGSGKGSSGADGADVGGFASGGGTPAISMPSLDTVPLSQSYQALQLPSLSLPSLNMPSLSMPNVSMPTLPAMQTPGTGSFQVPMPTVPPAQAASSGGKGSGGAVHEDVHHLMNEFNRVNGGALKGMDLGGNVSGQSNQGGIPNQISFLGIPIPLKKPTGFADGGYDDTGDDWALPTQPDQQPISSSPPPSSTDLGNDIPLPTPNPFREKPSTIGINDEIEGPPSLSRSIPPITPASSSQTSEWFPQREGSPPPYSASDIGNVIGETGSYVGNKLGQIPSSIDRLLGINYGNESDYKSPIQQYQEEQKQKEVPGAIQPQAPQPQAPQPQSGSLPDLATSVRSERYSPTGERLDTQQPSLAGLATPTSSTIPTSSLPPEQAQEYATAAKNAEDAAKANVPATQPGYSNRLAQIRAPYFDNLDDKTKDEVLRVARAENGGAGVNGYQDVIESMTNRAHMNGYKTLSQEVHSGFYGPVNRGIPSYIAPLTESQRAMGEKALENVRNGSNSIDYRTDQGMMSDPGSREYMQQPDHSGHMNVHGENYFYMGNKGRQWADQQRAAEGQAPNIPNAGANETLTEKGKQGGIPPLVPQQLLSQGYMAAKQAAPEIAKASDSRQPLQPQYPGVRDNLNNAVHNTPLGGILGRLIPGLGGQGGIKNFDAGRMNGDFSKKLLALGSILVAGGGGNPAGINQAASLLYGNDKGNDKQDKANEKVADSYASKILPDLAATKKDAFGQIVPDEEKRQDAMKQLQIADRASNGKFSQKYGDMIPGGRQSQEQPQAPQGAIPQRLQEQRAPQAEIARPQTTTPMPYTPEQKVQTADLAQLRPDKISNEPKGISEGKDLAWEVANYRAAPILTGTKEGDSDYGRQVMAWTRDYARQMGEDYNEANWKEIGQARRQYGAGQWATNIIGGNKMFDHADDVIGDIPLVHNTSIPALNAPYGYISSAFGDKTYQDAAQKISSDRLAHGGEYAKLVHGMGVTPEKEAEEWKAQSPSEYASPVTSYSSIFKGDHLAMGQLDGLSTKINTEKHLKPGQPGYLNSGRDLLGPKQKEIYDRHMGMEQQFNSWLRGNGPQPSWYNNPQSSPSVSSGIKPGQMPTQTSTVPTATGKNGEKYILQGGKWIIQ